MATLPTPIRAALGLAATAIDEARRLPETLPQLPVAAISTAMQASLRVQQHIAEYAARGDELLTALRGSSDEPPPWATFDEDDAKPATGGNGTTKAAFERIEAAVADDESGVRTDQSGSSGSTSAAQPTEPASTAIAAPAQKAAAKKTAAKKTAAKKLPPNPASAAKIAAPPAKSAATPAKKAAKKASAKATRSEPLEVAAERADPAGPPNPSVLAAEIVQAHQGETE